MIAKPKLKFTTWGIKNLGESKPSRRFGAKVMATFIRVTLFALQLAILIIVQIDLHKSFMLQSIQSLYRLKPKRQTRRKPATQSYGSKAATLAVMTARPPKNSRHQT
jgi:hypothetical protein